MQSCDDPFIWERCLQGFGLGIRVACLCIRKNAPLFIEKLEILVRLGIQRDAFVQALMKFTLLTENSSLSEVRPRNIDAIKLLINIGDENGNYLEDWYYFNSKFLGKNRPLNILPLKLKSTIFIFPICMINFSLNTL